KYKLVGLANARVKHLSPPFKEDRNYAMGKCQVINRRYFHQTHGHMSVALCYWATLGLMIANIGEGILLKNPDLFARAWGEYRGIVAIQFRALAADRYASERLKKSLVIERGSFHFAESLPCENISALTLVRNAKATSVMIHKQNRRAEAP